MNSCLDLSRVWPAHQIVSVGEAALIKCEANETLWFYEHGDSVTVMGDFLVVLNITIQHGGYYLCYKKYNVGMQLIGMSSLEIASKNNKRAFSGMLVFKLWPKFSLL